jgi:hypothetical protein
MKKHFAALIYNSIKALQRIERISPRKKWIGWGLGLALLGGANQPLAADPERVWYVSPGITLGYDFTEQRLFWGPKVSIGNANSDSFEYVNLTWGHHFYPDRKATGAIKSLDYLELQLGFKTSNKNGSQALIGGGVGTAWVRRLGSQAPTVCPKFSLSLGNLLFAESHFLMLPGKFSVSSGLLAIVPRPLSKIDLL